MPGVLRKRLEMQMATITGTFLMNGSSRLFFLAQCPSIIFKFWHQKVNIKDTRTSAHPEFFISGALGLRLYIRRLFRK